MAWARKRGERWQGQYRDPTGKIVSVGTRKLKKEALEVAQKAEMGFSNDPRRSKQLFEDYAEHYMSMVLNQSDTTVVGDESRLRTHLLPKFGRYPLGDIKPTEVRQWVSELSLRRNLAPGTVTKCYQLFSRIMRSAVEDDLLLKTPCVSSIKMPQADDEREMYFLTAEQLTHLADAIAPQFRATIFTMGYMGLRFGEMAGLRRPNLDLLHAKLNVFEAMKEVHGACYKGPTKNRKRRTLTIPPSLVAVLDEHLARYSKHPELVFTGRDGAVLRRHWNRRHFKPAALVAGLPADLRVHDLRHTCTAFLIDSGAYPKDICDFLGHSSIKVTMDVYGHRFPERDDQLAAMLEERFRAANGQQNPQVVDLRKRAK